MEESKEGLCLTITGPWISYGDRIECIGTEGKRGLIKVADDDTHGPEPIGQCGRNG